MEIQFLKNVNYVTCLAVLAVVLHNIVAYLVDLIYIYIKDNVNNVVQSKKFNIYLNLIYIFLFNYRSTYISIVNG